MTPSTVFQAIGAAVRAFLRRGHLPAASLELPYAGALHFHDGPILVLQANSAADAIDRLIRKSRVVEAES